MNIFEIIKLSLSNLFLNKFRSFLTMLGIIMGISSVILISSLGNGFQKKIFEDLSTETNNFIFINIKGKKITRNELIDSVDLKKIEALNNVKDVMTGINFSNAEDNLFKTVNAMDSNELKAWDIKLLKGRYFTTEEYKDRYTNSIMLDHITAKEIYKNQNPIGKFITLTLGNGKQQYQIVGIFKNYNEYAQKLASQKTALIIQPKIVYSSQNKLGLYRFLIVNVKNNRNMEQTISNIKHLLTKKTTKDRESIYDIKSFSQELGKITGVLDKISLMISLIAGIALIVGGIGVMNIMLVSVTERITEIGLRKALGAKNKDIRNQFLIESSVLTLVGGGIGLLLGYSLALLVSIPLGITPILTIKLVMIAVLTSIITGIVFGIYPARKAAKLTPMEALRKD